MSLVSIEKKPKSKNIPLKINIITHFESKYSHVHLNLLFRITYDFQDFYSSRQWDQLRSIIRYGRVEMSNTHEEEKKHNLMILLN